MELSSGDGQLFFIEHADRIEDTQGGFDLFSFKLF